MTSYSFLKLSLVAVLCHLASFQILSAQSRSLEMLIPYYSQETDNWCWAAAMKMVMDFHDPPPSTGPHPVTQCDLVKHLFKNDIPSLNMSSLPCCTRCNGSCASFGTPCSTSTNSLGNQMAIKTIPFTDEISPLPVNPDHFDLIFTKYGYSSVQEVNQTTQPFKWDKIKQQIESCRPFIINVQGVPTTSFTSNHALVVKGYKEDTTATDTTLYVIANDPWEPCCTTENESLFPYEIFDDPSAGTGGTLLVNHVLSSVHSIQAPTVFEDDPMDCLSCDLLETIYDETGTPFRQETEDGVPVETSFLQLQPSTDYQPPASLVANKLYPGKGKEMPGKPSRLLALLDKNPKAVVGYQRNRLNEDNLNGFLKSEEYFFAPVQYMTSPLVNRRYFLACLFPPRKLEKVIVPGVEVKDVVSGGVDANLVSTMQKRKDGTWALRRISTYTNLDKELNVRLQNQSSASVKLRNQIVPDTDAGITAYTLVKYLPFQYEFFHFDRNGTGYMAPAATYEELGLQAGIAYKEGRVIRALRRDTRLFEKFTKGLFPNLDSYKQYLGQQQNPNNIKLGPTGPE